MLDLGQLVLSDRASLVTRLGGKAMKSVVEGVDLEALQDFDKRDVASYRACRRAGTVMRVYDNRLSSLTTKTVEGRARECNVGQGETKMVPHAWYQCRLTNVVEGPFAIKAGTALKAEVQAFDGGYYRMNRRDPDNIRGYLVAYWQRGSDSYCSFFQESLSHMLYSKVCRRNLFTRGYGDRLTTEYKIVEFEEGDELNDEGAVIRDDTLLKQNNLECRHTKPADFGIHVNTPEADVNGAPGPGVGAVVTFLPMDRIMDKFVSAGVVADQSGVFVSRAKDPNGLAQDILALYCGTIQEFGVYGLAPVMILACLTQNDYKSIMQEWGLTPDYTGDLQKLAHFLRYRRGCIVVDGYYNSTKADLFRVRDYLALSNVQVGGGRGNNEQWWRPHEIRGVNGVVLPYASWQARLCEIYAITEYKKDSYVSIPQWETMRSVAIFRGVNLGGMIDYASQRTVGSVKNLIYFPGTDALYSLLDTALTLMVNWCVIEGENKLLGFRINWIGEDVDSPQPDTHAEICDDGMADRDLVTADDRWYIESRATWAAIQSPDVVFPVRTEIEEWRRSDVVRFGNLTVYSSQSEQSQISRMLSVIDLQAEIVEYTFVSSVGTQSLRLAVTNSTNPLVYLDWSGSLDQAIQGRLESDAFAVCEGYDAKVVVRWDSRSALGRFNGLGGVVGLRNI